MSNVLPNDARQYSLSAYINLDFEDIPGSALVNVAEIPQGSVITFIELFVETTFAGGTTHDLEIGDDVDIDRYTPTISELDGSAGRPANVPVADGHKTVIGEENLTVTPVSTGGNPTSGAARLLVEYITDGRHNENRG